MRVLDLNEGVLGVGNNGKDISILSREGGFGESVKPSTFRIVDYSEVNHDRGTGEIEFLKGSSIDEATITVMFEETNEEKEIAHDVYQALANLPHEQYVWQPNNDEDATEIQGYRKEVQLNILELGGITLRIRILGIQTASQGANPTNVRRAPYIVARGGENRITVAFIIRDNTSGYELETSRFEVGPWERLGGTTAIPATNSTIDATGSHVHTDLITGDIHYYRARLYQQGTVNENPWSEVVAAQVG